MSRDCSHSRYRLERNDDGLITCCALTAERCVLSPAQGTWQSGDNQRNLAFARHRKHERPRSVTQGQGARLVTLHLATSGDGLRLDRPLRPLSASSRPLRRIVVIPVTVVAEPYGPSSVRSQPRPSRRSPNIKVTRPRVATPRSRSSKRNLARVGNSPPRRSR